MSHSVTRRSALALGGAAIVSPRVARAQGDNRPSITVAVQKISNSNTLDVLREQSNVGERIFFSSLWEGLIGRNWLGGLESVPGLATEWKRLDDKTVELKLRQGVKFHNGDEMTGEDVAFTFSRERMFGETPPKTRETVKFGEGLPTFRNDKQLPPEVPGVARRSWPDLVKVEVVDRYTVRFINGSPDVTLEGRLSRFGSEIMNRRAFEEATSWLEWARKPVTTGPYRVAEYRPDVSLTYEAHDQYWGGTPPLKRIRFIEVPEVASRINGLYAGEYQFACDIPPDQITGIEKNTKFEVQGGTILNHRLTCFDQTNAALADPLVRRAFTHAMDRQMIVDSLWAGRTVVPKGLQWPYYGDMFLGDWAVPAYDVALARDLLKKSAYKGEPITYRLLNNYYINQVATAQVLVEMWKEAGLNVVIEMKENFSQVFEKGPARAVRDWSSSAPFNDPVSSIVNQWGPNGQARQVGEYLNKEVVGLSEILETSTDHQMRLKAHRRMLEVLEREDPAYTVLHQNAVFTAKPRDLPWKAAGAFAMDFRPGNWGRRS